MRKAVAAGAVAAVLVLAGGGVANAQRHGGGGRGATAPSASPQGSQPPQGTPGRGGGGAVSGRPGGYHAQPLNLHKEALGTVGVAAEARQRMRNGDCAGALDLFDQALLSSVDPTLFRDRGLCHERLGNPYPAMDDFRTYLSNMPDAADADDIRQRLARIEMDVYHHSSAPTGSSPESSEPSEPVEKHASAETSEPAETSTPTEGSAKSTSSWDGPEAPPSASIVDDDTKRDAMEDVEHDHDEMRSPIRAGQGVSLAPFFAEHKWIIPGSSFGNSATWSEAVGLQFRYSFNAHSALVAEAGFESFNSTETATISGLTSLLGYELRVPFDAAYNNQLLIGVGMGFEYLVLADKTGNFSNLSTWGFIPSARVGWRHLLTKSVGFDLTVGGGVWTKALSQNGGDLTNNDGASEILAVNLSLAWGL